MCIPQFRKLLEQIRLCPRRGRLVQGNQHMNSVLRASTRLASLLSVRAVLAKRSKVASILSVLSVRAALASLLRAAAAKAITSPASRSRRAEAFQRPLDFLHDIAAPARRLAELFNGSAQRCHLFLDLRNALVGLCFRGSCQSAAI